MSCLRSVSLSAICNKCDISTALCRKAYTGIFHIHALIAYTKVSCKFIIHYPRILVPVSGQPKGVV